MKETKMSFAEGFMGPPAGVKKSALREFDWTKAAKIIMKELKNHPNLVAEAGLNGDWDHTGGIIFEKGKPTDENYTYLASSWAEPTLIISWNGKEQIEEICAKKGNNAEGKWTKEALELFKVTFKKYSKKV